MPSIIQGFEYDIFISYRHKDNKYDHWVTDFVDNLSKELESTFKHNISIYFDQNPHDGLHETDDVNGSLAPKLKSLILIPIVSQTYCDPESFAWRNELLAFVRNVSSDELGLRIRNIRGNVTSRVLPVRIHDLEPDDQKLFEEATGGPFRPVDFVYRAKGFADMSAAHDQEYFADGMSEELLNVLSKIPGLLVTARTSAFSFKGKNEDVREIGKKLNVSYVLEGSVRKDGDLARITTQLINTATGSHIWSQTYDREITNIFAIQDEIATAVAEQLRLKIQFSGVRRARESTPKMYQTWLAAQYHYQLGTTEGANEAYRILKQAYESDSTDARITSMYGLLTNQMSRYTANAELSQNQRDMASRLGYKAIKLDSNFVGAYIHAGLIQLGIMNFDEGKRFLDKAAALEPTNYLVIANLGYQKLLFGEFEGAEAMFKKLTLLDRLSPDGYAELGRTLLRIGRYQEAVANARKAVALGSWEQNYDKLTQAYLLAGKPDSALVCTRFIGHDEFWQRYYQSMAFWSQGKQKESNDNLNWLIENDSHDGAFQIAEIYSWRGDKEKSIQWLERSVKQNDIGLFEINLSPFLNYPEDPRYKNVVREIGLPSNP